MARYSIFDLRSDIKRKLSTSNPSASLDFYAAIDEARRNVIARIAPPEMIRENYLEQAIFDRVDAYAVPEDMNYDDMVMLKKLSSYRNVDTLDHPFELIYRKRFGQKRRGSKNVMNVSYTNGLKTASIYHPRGQKQNQQKLVHNCDSLFLNGTWNVGGNLVNLTEDHLNYVEGKGSLLFDFDNSGTYGFIENFTLQTVDLLDYLQIGAIFASFSVSLPKEVLAMTMKFYSSPTDYFEYSVAHPHDSNEFKEGWNIMKFLFDTKYQTGTPNPKEINHIRFEFTTTGKQINDCRLDSIFARKGEVYEATYFSSYCIIDGKTGAWKHRATDGTDKLPFEDDSYQVYMLECALVLQKELYLNNYAAQSDVERVTQDLEKAYTNYQMRHKSEVIEEYDTMYVMGDYMTGYQDDILDGYEYDDGEFISGNN